MTEAGFISWLEPKLTRGLVESTSRTIRLTEFTGIPAVLSACITGTGSVSAITEETIHSNATSTNLAIDERIVMTNILVSGFIHQPHLKYANNAPIISTRSQ
jgi:hypothetical protein